MCEGWNNKQSEVVVVLVERHQTKLLYLSPWCLCQVVETALVIMDGTFSVAPHPFKQLYPIRVPFKDVTGTAVYAFLPNKCQDTYRELFQSTLGHHLCKDLVGFVSGVGCQVFHGVSGFWVLDACITGSVMVWLPRNWNTIMKKIVEHQHMVKPYLVYSMP
jgi:hypothetical protein